MAIKCFFENMDWNDGWTCLCAIATTALAAIAWIQLRNLNRTAQSEFLNKLKNEFFTKDARDLLILLETSSLKFNKDTGVEGFAIFEVKISEQLQKYLGQRFDPARKYYYTQEIDDFLLGHLEDAGLLLKTGRITIEDADQQFQYYVSTLYNDDQIQAYIQWAKEQGGDTDIYGNLKTLNDRLQEYEKNFNRR